MLSKTSFDLNIHELKHLNTSTSFVFSARFRTEDRRRLAKLGQGILLLSTNANIISKMTAFVAIDKEANKPVEGEMEKRSCPVPVATPGFEDRYMYGHDRRKRKMASVDINTISLHELLVLLLFAL